MAYTLLYHPLSSYCMKVVTALYESGTPFTPKSVNLQDEAERNALLKLWPIGKFPVLRDEERDVLLLVAHAQMSYGEVAQALDLPVGTVRSRLNRARRIVRAALDDTKGSHDDH